MYTLIQKINKEPELDREIFSYEFDPYYLTIQPNIKASNFNEFKEELLASIIEHEENSIEDEGDFYEEYKDEEWYQDSLHYLGEEKFRKKLEDLYCNSLIGNWRNVYINLSPYFIDSTPHYAQVKFEKVPSIAELLYTHSRIWQEFYESKNRDIKEINHHYSIIKIRGDNYYLIFDPSTAS